MFSSLSLIPGCHGFLLPWLACCDVHLATELMATGLSNHESNPLTCLGICYKNEK